MKQLIPLIALIALSLLPYAWLARLSPALYRFFNETLSGDFAHAVGHALIFAAVGLVALRALPTLRDRPAVYFALILLVALGQEGFQVLYKAWLPLADTLRDILVDLAAAAGVWAAVRHAGAPASPRVDLLTALPVAQNTKERGSDDQPARG
jgi:hypothetical protein